MHDKNKQIIKIIIILLGFAAFLWLIYRFLPYKPAANSNTLKEEAIPSVPLRLKIPRINVDASVDQVGLTTLGAMDVPKSPANTAWYMAGVRPGEIGSAVIDGHSGWKNNIPAAFDNLGKLKKGDKIYVEDSKGITTTFVVRELKMYDPSADAKEVFYSNDGQSHLNLITCAGLWNDVDKTHTQRLIVFSDKE